MLLFVSFLFLEVFVSARIASPKEPFKTVNLNLETVLEFDNKDNSADIKFLDNVQQFITKVRSVINNNKNSRRDFRVQNTNLFTSFIQELINIVLTYDDSIFREFIDILDEEIRKYHYRGCKFYELIENIEIRKSFASKLEFLKRQSVPIIKENLNSIAININNDLNNENVKELLDYINSLYRQDSLEKFEKVLTDFVRFGKSKRKRTSSALVQIVRDAIRSIIFDYYTELNPNARRELASKIQDFIKNNNSPKNKISDKTNTGTDIYVPVPKPKVEKFKPVKLKKKFNNKLETKAEDNSSDDFARIDVKETDFKINKKRNLNRTETGINLDKINSVKHKRLNVHVLAGADTLPFEEIDKFNRPQSKEIIGNIKRDRKDNEIVSGESYDDPTQTDEEDQTTPVPLQTLYTEVHKNKKTYRLVTDEIMQHRNHSPKKLSSRRPHIQTLWVESTGGLPKYFLKRTTTAARNKRRKKQWIHVAKLPKHTKREEYQHNNLNKVHHWKKHKPRDETSEERRPLRERKEHKSVKKDTADRLEEDPVEKENKKYLKNSIKYKKNVLISTPDFDQQVKQIDNDFKRTNVRLNHRNRYAKHKDHTRPSPVTDTQKDKAELKDKTGEDYDEPKTNGFVITPFKQRFDATTLFVRPSKTSLAISFRTDSTKPTTENEVWSPPGKFRGPMKALAEFWSPPEKFRDPVKVQSVNNLRSMRKFASSSEDVTSSDKQSDTNDSDKKYNKENKTIKDVEERVFEKLKNIEEELHVVRNKIEVTKRNKHRNYKKYESETDKSRKHKKHERGWSHDDNKYSSRDNKRKYEKYNSYEEDTNTRLRHIKKSHMSATQQTKQGKFPKKVLEKSSKHELRGRYLENDDTETPEESKSDKYKQKDFIKTTPAREDKHTQKERVNKNREDRLSSTEKRERYAHPEKTQRPTVEWGKNDFVHRIIPSLTEKREKYRPSPSIQTPTAAEEKKYEYPEKDDVEKKDKYTVPENLEAEKIEKEETYTPPQKVQNPVVEETEMVERPENDDVVSAEDSESLRQLQNNQDLRPENSEQGNNPQKVRLSSTDKIEIYTPVYPDKIQTHAAEENEKDDYIQRINLSSKENKESDKQLQQIPVTKAQERENDGYPEEKDEDSIEDTESLRQQQKVQTPTAEEGENIDNPEEVNEDSEENGEIDAPPQNIANPAVEEKENDEYPSSTKATETYTYAYKQQEMQSPIKEENDGDPEQHVHFDEETESPTQPQDINMRAQDEEEVYKKNPPSLNMKALAETLKFPEMRKDYNYPPTGFTTTINYIPADKSEDVVRYVETKLAKTDKRNYYNNVAKRFGKDVIVPRTVEKDQELKNRVEGLKEIPKVKPTNEYRPQLNEQQYDNDHNNGLSPKTTISTTTTSKATPTSTKSTTTAMTRQTTTEKPWTRLEIFIPVSEASNVSTVMSNKSVTEVTTETNNILLPVTSGLQKIPSKDLNIFHPGANSSVTNSTSGRKAGEPAVIDLPNSLNDAVQKYLNKTKTEDVARLMVPQTDNDLFGPLPSPPDFNASYDMNNFMLNYKDNYKDTYKDDLDLLL